MESRFYPTTWEEYRKSRRITWMMLFTGPFVVIALSAPFIYYFKSEVPGFIIASSWLAIVFWESMQAHEFKCPRCGKPFFHKTWSSNGFARACVHCGLPKWEVSKPNDKKYDAASDSEFKPIELLPRR